MTPISRACLASCSDVMMKFDSKDDCKEFFQLDGVVVAIVVGLISRDVYDTQTVSQLFNLPQEQHAQPSLGVLYCTNFLFATRAALCSFAKRACRSGF